MADEIAVLVIVDGTDHFGEAVHNGGGQTGAEDVGNGVGGVGFTGNGGEHVGQVGGHSGAAGLVGDGVGVSQQSLDQTFGIGHGGTPLDVGEDDAGGGGIIVVGAVQQVAGEDLIDVVDVVVFCLIDGEGEGGIIQFAGLVGKHGCGHGQHEDQNQKKGCEFFHVFFAPFFIFFYFLTKNWVGASSPMRDLP